MLPREAPDSAPRKGIAVAQPPGLDAPGEPGGALPGAEPRPPLPLLILDAVFDPLATGGVQFRQAAALTPVVLASIAEQVRRRVVRWFARRGLLDPDDVQDMLAWEHGGFSLDASVCIAGHDWAGLERLLRYCARPRFAVRFTGYSRQSVGNYQGQLLEPTEAELSAEAKGRSYI